MLVGTYDELVDLDDPIAQLLPATGVSNLPNAQLATIRENSASLYTGPSAS